MTMMKDHSKNKIMKQIAIFVSGNGTNCENLIRYFKDSDEIRVALVLSNKADAYALVRAQKLGVETAVMGKKDFMDPEKILPLLRSHSIDFIVLAGFLLFIPNFLIETYDHRMINLHPALLPKFGGKGMWGAPCARGCESRWGDRDGYDGALGVGRHRWRTDHCTVPYAAPPDRHTGGHCHQGARAGDGLFPEGGRGDGAPVIIRGKTDRAHGCVRLPLHSVCPILSICVYPVVVYALPDFVTFYFLRNTSIENRSAQ